MLEFLAGTLLPETRLKIEEHLAVCSVCTDLVTWAAADQVSETHLPGHEGRPFVGQLQPGARVGRYQVLGAVGRGGMGEVYAAYHPDLDRRIALKVVQGIDGGTGERRVRLLREARAVARLSHPNVVTVHDAGTFGDRVYIAMELISGRTIDQWLRDEPRTWRQILDVFVAAGRGLVAAHAAGVVHRDFKPQNVMIAKDGAVRVMDFGLARLSEEEAIAPARDAAEDEPTLPIDNNLTKTGALVGTPAYMSPEQFRREAIDARSDQFSFCVALHEALFGSRPAAAPHAGGGSPTGDGSVHARRASVPGWLRAIVLRGAAPDRDQRYWSMTELLAALERARTRTRRRVSVAAVGLAVLVVGAGTWRIARGNRIACAVPQERMASAWSNDAGDPRRQSLHRAFAASGRAAAETSWDRMSAALDEYMRAWGFMYRETCEATNVRGEQSAGILDLRMSCLSDNLDQVRALTDALVTADAAAVSRAVTAANDLTPVSRCADIALLRSAVPLPRDERTLREVQRLRRSLAEAKGMRDVGKVAWALAKIRALLPEVKNTGYRPLLGAALLELGLIQSDNAPAESEKTLEDCVMTAESAGDEETAAQAAASLAYAVGFQLGRGKEGMRWASLAHAFLDRLGGEHSTIRGWILGNDGTIAWSEGDFDRSRKLIEQSVGTFVSAPGTDHLSLGMAFSNLAFALIPLHRSDDALVAADRAARIFSDHGDPNSPFLGNAIYNRGEALRAVGRLPESRAAFESSLQLAESNAEAMPTGLGDPLTGLGEIDIAEGKATAAVPLLERALSVRPPGSAQEIFIADTQFALARALWGTGGDKRRARYLAAKAREVYARHHHLERGERAELWLAAHPRS